MPLMETLLFILIVAAFVGGYKFGRKEGADSAWLLQAKLVNDGMAPDSAFSSAYGLPGLYLADTNPHLEGLPLVALSSARFLDLIAKQQSSVDATEEEIKELKSTLADRYLRASGWSEAKIEAVKDVSARF